MKFQFKIQEYQTEAVESVIKVFRGQPMQSDCQYRRDVGQWSQRTIDELEETGYCNADVVLTKPQLLNNIREIQIDNQITPSSSLATGYGIVNLDIEMETGTGKTYVYIKTMHELNKRYGWSKFVIVVPSIAIREGVAKSFGMLEDHFMEQYGKKARYFIYNSSRLNELDRFSQESGISVMIVNTQAFATSLKEDGKSKESRIIYSEQDDFGSRRPIDVIAANRPIIIMDEPQKMEGKTTQESLANFKPLFTLNYSATHKSKHDTVYALDAYDAYKQKLVKRIQVCGFEVVNLKGMSGYMYVDSIVLSPTKPPEVSIELECKRGVGSIRRVVKKFMVGDSLKDASGLVQYEGYTVSEINPRGHGSVTFLNGVTMNCGEVAGDTNEETMQRVQIRQTIVAHLEKERELYSRGIKCLSLFFVDEVGSYRRYDNDGNEVKGKFQEIFEEEYIKVVDNYISAYDEPYDRYLKSVPVEKTHKGYFSIDKQGHSVNSATKRNSDVSDDISAYDLILKNKERLLSFEEPTRFIFSHSALREGWDNPNVFQICTLRHSNSTTAKRQEVGRGLRLCVDKDGLRQDKELLGEEVHEINRLTIIANESYADFTAELQRETREALRERVTVISQEYLLGKVIRPAAGERRKITMPEAAAIQNYLFENGYADSEGRLTPIYDRDACSGELKPLPPSLEAIRESVFKLISGIFNPELLRDMTEDVKPKLESNYLNDNFSNERFQQLWNEINHKYVYTVHYNSDELIEKAVEKLRRDLTVSKLQYIMTTGEQDGTDVAEFNRTRLSKNNLNDTTQSAARYDVVGDIAQGARLTRRTVVKILQRIGPKLLLFNDNPEEFIRNVVKGIRLEKATMIVNHITYNPSAEEPYDSTIFVPKCKIEFENALELSKHITPYLTVDSGKERDFAAALDIADDVMVFAKLPRRFKIPTPVGDYAPDWAIVFHDGTVRHVFFVAETKGSLDDMDFRGVERAKTECAKRLFNSISTNVTRYGVVENYGGMATLINGID